MPTAPSPESLSLHQSRANMLTQEGDIDGMFGEISVSPETKQALLEDERALSIGESALRGAVLIDEPVKLEVAEDLVGVSDNDQFRAMLSDEWLDTYMKDFAADSVGTDPFSFDFDNTAAPHKNEPVAFSGLTTEEAIDDMQNGGTAAQQYGINHHR